MGDLNCLRCKYRHEDNGKCTATGGFCTVVPAAHCQLLREYLDIGLTPEQCDNAKTIIEAAFADDTLKAERIRELLKADEEQRVMTEDVEKYQNIDREKTPSMYVPHLPRSQYYNDGDLKSRTFEAGRDLISMRRTFNGKFYTTPMTLQDFSWQHGLGDILLDFHRSGSTCVTYFGHDFVLNNSFQEEIIYFVKEE